MRFTYAIQRRREITPEEKAANVAKRDARKQAAMTCQCCGGKYLANRGRVAHHGYQRPGTGWQTRSCIGATYLPFEVSRDRLADAITMLANTISNLNIEIADVTAERVPLHREFKSYKGAARGYETIRVEFTRETFDAVRAANEALFRQHSLHDFNKCKASKLLNLESEVRHYSKWKTEQEARFAGWTQTHKRENNEWVSL